MRIAVVYDCLFPNTVGGAERWYRSLSERLGAEHQVTYLTRRQWGAEGPETPFETIAVAPGGPLYDGSGKRRTLPPLRFGWGVFWHLLLRGRRYDAVHSASFPYFSVIGAWAALRLGRSRARLVVDWHELWGREYWLRYLGPVGGRVGFAVESFCLRLPDRSFAFSALVAERLARSRHSAPLTRLTGEYVDERDSVGPPAPAAQPPYALFAGRHIAEKRASAIPAAIVAAREHAPELRCVIVGDGPEEPAVRAEVERRGLDDVIELRGRVDPAEVVELIRHASCLLHPSEREGYGLVVVEALAEGVPAVLCRAPENAATELIEQGTNGFVAESASPGELATAVLAALDGGEALRDSTIAWYREHRERLSLDGSLDAVSAAYGAGSSP